MRPALKVAEVPAPHRNLSAAIQRRSNFRVRFNKNDDSNLFHKDATFYAMDGLT
ncbi:MAG: AbfB domain-containing protein [Hyphomicrobiaceae bacterium]|nr:AbfB domain-containing protein [Hyphomicrobiaceae bacterium]